MIEATPLRMAEAEAFANGLLPYTRVHGAEVAIVTGSLVFNGRGHDIDVVLGPVFNEDVLTDGQLQGIHAELVHALGCTVTSKYGILGEEPGDKGFKMHCYRKGIYNILLVDRGVENWDKARNVCVALTKAMHCTISKRQRVAIHKVLVDGMDAEEAAALTLRQVTEDYT